MAPSTSYEKSSNTNMDEIAVVLRRFGDEQSTLLDQFERLTFEVQLNQAILRRSFSEPGVGAVSKSQPPGLLPLLNTYKQPSKMATQTQKKKRKASGIGKVLRKFFKPIFAKKGSSSNNMDNNKIGGRCNETPDPKNPKFFKAFSRSLRL